MSSEHPSYFALDRLALGVPDAETSEHVATCARCAAYIASITPLEAPMPLSMHRRKRTPRAVIAVSVLVPLLAAAAIFLVLRASQAPAPIAMNDAPRDPYIGTRGTPAIGLYVRRGASIALWDGAARFAAGDTIRIKVIPEGFDTVHVYALEQGRPTELYDGPLVPDDAGETLLPSAWQLDADSGSETIVVVLSRGPFRTPTNDVLTRDRDGETLWVRRFVLEKEPAH
jgi:hypothetical protein